MRRSYDPDDVEVVVADGRIVGYEVEVPEPQPERTGLVLELVRNGEVLARVAEVGAGGFARYENFDRDEVWEARAR